MASSMPLPIPPRTPTPPSDDGAYRYAPRSTPGVPIDRDALSPLRDTFPRSIALDTESQDRLSPIKTTFNLSPGAADGKNGSADATPAGPFNFDTTVMAKGPVVKSVRILLYIDCCYAMLMILILLFRTSGNDEVTSTNTVASLIRSFSSPRHARLLLCPIPCPFPH